MTPKMSKAAADPAAVDHHHHHHLRASTELPRRTGNTEDLLSNPHKAATEEEGTASNPRVAMANPHHNSKAVMDVHHQDPQDHPREADTHHRATVRHHNHQDIKGRDKKNEPYDMNPFILV